MLPILRILANGDTWRTREIVERIGEEFDLSEDEMREMIPSGRAKLIQNRVGWANTYLRKAGLIESVRRGYNRISTTGREIRDFAGALLGKRSMKGVFITTSTFPAGAHDFVASIDRRIILIDGDRLASLMIQYNLGVSMAETVQLKELDYDYFGN